MLIQFSIRNFRTFKEKAVLSLIASNYDKDTRTLDNIFQTKNYKLKILKSAVIYGANASGKSKLIEALAFMQTFVINSSRESQAGDKIEVEPFRLSSETEDQPSEFEVVFIYQKIMYRYGFEVDKNKVVAEWLYHKPKIKEIELFYRNYQEFETHAKDFSIGKDLVDKKKIRENALLLSRASQDNDTTCINVINWFRNLEIISGLSERGYGATLKKIKEGKKDKILELLKVADLSIEDLRIEMLDLDQLPKNMPEKMKDFLIKKSKEENTELISDILTSHKKYDENKKNIGSVDFSLDDDESSGTSKFFALTGRILDVFENGYTLVVDELDSKLHLNLVAKIISLFNSKTLNPNNAQLIFNTHDTNLLSENLFRKDQIWFTEKDKYGAARLYSLADFKGLRKVEAFEDNYLRGKYGAIPFLQFFDNLSLLNTAEKDENEG